MILLTLLQIQENLFLYTFRGSRYIQHPPGHKPFYDGTGASKTQIQIMKMSQTASFILDAPMRIRVNACSYFNW